MELREIINKIWRDVRFQFFMDVVRVLLVVLVIVFIIILIKNIEAVRLFGYDVCKICANRTGCCCNCLG